MTPLMISILTGGGVVAAAVLLALAAGRLAGTYGCRDGRERPADDDDSQAGEPGCVALQKCVRARNDKRSQTARLVTAAVVLLAALPVITQVWPDLLDSAGIGVLVSGGVIVVLLFLIGLSAARRRLAFAQKAYENQVATGRALAPLADQGYCLFHDYCNDRDDAGDGAGCDHLVVGPKGVFAVTVHTPKSKVQDRGDRGGVSTATVTYDGRALQFGRYSDYDVIAQAGRAAEALSEMISEVLREPVAARAIVSMPGWTVRRVSSEGISVVNPKQFSSLFEHINARPLGRQQINLIKTHLHGRDTLRPGHAERTD